MSFYTYDLQNTGCAVANPAHWGATNTRYRYREPKPGLNFGIDIGAETFSAETESEIYCMFSSLFDNYQTKYSIY